MMPTHSGSIRLFRFAGITVFLHWSWFLVAIYEISIRAGTYSSPIWNVAEYITLFAVVTLHEFGHSLACRQTGGQTHDIVLWPLGGVAFVAPPPRPGATLWSIAAGPLVNVALVPVFYGLLYLLARLGWLDGRPDLAHFLFAINVMNLFLLGFNLVPIYPLDGGQILRSLLWFGVGRARSLQVSAIIGIFGIAIAVVWRFSGARDPSSMVWDVLIAVFLAQRCWMGLREAKFLRALERAPRHAGFACPTCHQAPPGGPIWGCGTCRQPFDPFSTGGICPHCQTPQPSTPCVNCGARHPIDAWRVGAAPSAPPVIDV
jgi:Zn-dependent protease